MTIVTLSSELGAATSLLDLARRLGRACLGAEGRLADLRAEADNGSTFDYLVALIEAVSFDEWEPRPEAGLAHILTMNEIGEYVDLVSTQHPLEHLAFLRGLCPALTEFFERTEGRVGLDLGLPIPWATRPIHELYGRATPHQPNLASRSLLTGTGFDLFRHSDSDSVRVTLDFSQRDRLDELTWSRARRLPVIATMHPSMRSEDLEFSTEGNTFFDVRPRHWSLEETLSWLRSVSEHEIAILPELCLPFPDALAESLAAAPSDYPSLIVAGSAHVRHDDQIRANECHVYLEGELVHVHRKIHPLRTRKLGDTRLVEEIVEGITLESKDLVILSGRYTRVGVVICADLNEGPIPELLEAAGVNLLLAPAFTYSAGAFNGAVAGLASRCQAVCAVVNTDLRTASGSSYAPFLIFGGVPRPDPLEQSCLYPAPHEADAPPVESIPPCGLFDPNLQLTDAISWTVLTNDQAGT